MLVTFVTLEEKEIEARPEVMARLLQDGDVIQWRADVPLESVAFGEWLEQWHRENNPDLIRFGLVEPGGTTCLPD